MPSDQLPGVDQEPVPFQFVMSAKAGVTAVLARRAPSKAPLARGWAASRVNPGTKGVE